MTRVLALVALGLLLALPAAAETVLFERDHVLVTRDGPYRILSFKGPDGPVEQSRCDERHPEWLFHEYSRMQLLGLLYVPQPRRILVVGLGGASLTRALAAALPEAKIDNVEIDPLVVEAARRWFFYREGTRMRTFLQDARQYARSTPERYDLVFLDAYDGDEIPYPLRTEEFYRSIRDLLAPGGAVVANLMLRSPLYHRDRRTFAEVFPSTAAFVGMGNVVLVAGDLARRPSREDCRELSRRFGDSYPLEGYFDALQAEDPWDRKALPLTDAGP